MVDFAIDGLDEMVAFAIDGLGMTWQLHIKTRTKVRVFRAKNYLLKVPSPRNKSGHTSESCRDGDCTSC